MGTNYYARIDECECCGRFEELHLGKSSGSWCFSLHVYPEKQVNNLDDLLELIRDEEATIYNEYGDKVSGKDFLKIVTERSWPVPKTDPNFYGHPNYKNLNQFLELNYVELGPNNLLRHKIDGQFCIGHGEGTWDYCVGEFS